MRTSSFRWPINNSITGHGDLSSILSGPHQGQHRPNPHHHLLLRRRCHQDDGHHSPSPQGEETAGQAGRREVQEGVKVKSFVTTTLNTVWIAWNTLYIMSCFFKSNWFWVCTLLIYFVCSFIHKVEVSFKHNHVELLLIWNVSKHADCSLKSSIFFCWQVQFIENISCCIV